MIFFCSQYSSVPTCRALWHPAAPDALLDLSRAVPDAAVACLHAAAAGAAGEAAAGGGAGRPGAPLGPVAPVGKRQGDL